MSFATPHKHIPAGPQKLAYWRFGKGPDVVLVHGWPLHSATFRNIVPLLADDFTLHLFDLPGVGQSESHGPVGFVPHAVALRKAIDHLGLDEYALIAHDSGGVIARLLAVDDDRVRGMVLSGTEIPGHRPANFETFVKLLRVPGFTTLMLAAMRIGFVRRSAYGFGGCFTDPGYVDGDFADWFIRPFLESRRVSEAHLRLARTLDFGFIDTLVDIHQRTTFPVHCIWGTDDPFFPIDKARGMLEQFAGGADLVEIPGAKLFPHEDHPEAFVAHALRFLQRCLPAAEKAA